MKSLSVFLITQDSEYSCFLFIFGTGFGITIDPQTAFPRILHANIC